MAGVFQRTGLLARPWKPSLAHGTFSLTPLAHILPLNILLSLSELHALSKDPAESPSGVADKYPVGLSARRDPSDFNENGLILCGKCRGGVRNSLKVLEAPGQTWPSQWTPGSQTFLRRSEGAASSPSLPMKNSLVRL